MTNNLKRLELEEDIESVTNGIMAANEISLILAANDQDTFPVSFSLLCAVNSMDEAFERIRKYTEQQSSFRNMDNSDG